MAIGKTAEVTQLLAAGADPSGHTAIVQALRDAGADLNAKNTDGY